MILLRYALLVMVLVLAGCVGVRALQPGQGSTAFATGTTATIQQSENPVAPSIQVVSESVSESQGGVVTTIERSVTTQLGAAQKDMARELGARLSNMRGVMWVGLALMIGGPLVGWKLGWLVNGMLAGAVGLGLVILATVLPGNEAWFGLGGLVVLPIVAYVYYRARHDEKVESTPPKET